ncbi:hypothetical protein BDA99DRAFT_520217 [Phascolomyces articulosus]|uniref:N-formylglutamate amidohydrolase n=1 Tax=Phascolomyces articulosus TaxID=60185 RepID=A0AAD5K6A4_9FUNG|nr:hypothetical protein BDA99DRAFT_520217 [Phascolomyces articulosus]
MKQNILLFIINFIIIMSNTIPVRASPSNNDISYYRGDIPLVLTVPHGGNTKNGAEIPDRPKNDDNILVNDAYTISTAQSIADNISDYYGSRPYVVICNIPRHKVDVNRPIELAADSEEGKGVWKEYHQAIQHAIDEIRTRHNRQGLLLDIHGHKRHDLIMLGYLLSKEELIDSQNDPDRTDQVVLEKTSIQTLASRISFPDRPGDLLRGEGSFGELIEYAATENNDNIKTVPSPSHPAPTEEEHYFTGGYTTQAYHAQNTEQQGNSSSGLDAIQIELPQRLRFTSDQRQAAAKAIAEATVYWLDHYYQPVVLNKALL